MPNTRKVLDKAIKAMDDGKTYGQYLNAIRNGTYETASRMFRQAEQDSDITDEECDRLLDRFRGIYGAKPK